MLKRALMGLGICLAVLSLCSMLLLVGGVLGGMMGYVSARFAAREVAPRSREQPVRPEEMWPEVPNRQREEPTPAPLPYRMGPGMLGALVSPVRVTEVEEDGPAAEAGMRIDDIIIAIDGMALDANHHLSEAIRSYDPGDEVTLTLIRSDQETEVLEVGVTLGRDTDEEGKVVAHLGIWYQHMSAVVGPRQRGEGPWD
jgi:membrane-associated protease RseP (regulator of RpoE activity)